MRSYPLVFVCFRYYFIMVAMFFTVSVVNNYALNLNIAMPLHMIFRSVSSIRPSFSMTSLFITSASTVPAACILPP